MTFWINALFWIAILLWFLNEHYSISYDYLRRRYDEHLSAEPFAGRCFLLVRLGLPLVDWQERWDRIDIDELIDEVRGSACCKRDRVFIRCVLPILKLKRRSPSKEWLPIRSMCTLVGYFCYETLYAVFALTAFIAVESYFYVDKYIGYLEETEHILFYAIPLGIFAIALFIINKIKKTELCWSQAFLAFIISFCLSYPTSFFYDWEYAKDEYESAMEEEYGEEWEEVIEEMESEYEP